MANSVVKLTIDGQEYDAQLKKAGQALNDYFDICKKGDRTFEVLDDDVLEAVKAMGQMETVSKSASGQLKEMESTFSDLSLIYQRFTDEEKNADIGKATAQSLQELKSRILETRESMDFSKQSLNGVASIKSELRELTQEIATTTIAYRSLSDAEKESAEGKEMQAKIQRMTERAGTLRDAFDDANRSIKGFSSDTQTFDRISQGVAFLTSSFQTAIGAAKLFGINVGDNVEVLAKLQAAMAVTNGLTQIQTALQKESALMQGVLAVQAKAAAAAIALQGSSTKMATAAQAAFNAVAKANPYVLLASAVAAIGTALIGFSDNSKKATQSITVETEAMRQAQQMTEIWRNSLSSTFSSLMTKYDELKRQWMSLKDEHKKTEWIKKNQQALENLGGAVNDVKSAEDFFNNNTDAVVQSFVRRAQAAARVAQLTELYRKQIDLIDKKEQTQRAISTDAAYKGRTAQAGQEIEDTSFWNSRYGTVDKEGKWRFTEEGAKLYSGTDTSTAEAVVKLDVEIEANKNEIEKIKGQITNEFNDFVVTPQINGENKNNDKFQVKGVQGFNVKDIKELSLGTTESMNELRAKLNEYQNMLANATDQFVASAAQEGIKETQRLIDAQPLALKLGISADAAADIQDKVKSLKDIVQEGLESDPIVIKAKLEQNADDITEDAKENKDAWTAAAKAVQSVGSALRSIEDPGAKVAGIIGQAIANIALGFAQATASKATTATGVFGWIAAIAGGLGTMIGTISAIKSATAGSYAEGGIVPGNSFSGDNLTANVNSGELILSRAQQNNIAADLMGRDDAGAGFGSMPYVTGEKIVLGINNWGRKMGYGELVFSRG